MGTNSKARRDAKRRNAKRGNRPGRPGSGSFQPGQFGQPGQQPPCDCPSCQATAFGGTDTFGGTGPFGRTDAFGRAQSDAGERPGSTPYEKNRNVDEQIRLFIAEGIRACMAGQSTSAAVVGLRKLPVAVVDQSLDFLLKAAVGRAWESGWQPSELYDRGRLQSIGNTTMTCLIGAIALQMAGYAPATIDPRWSDQLELLDASEWWPSDRTFFGSFATQLVGSREAALLAAIEVGALLSSLPRIERLLPLPGTARSNRPVAPANVDAKVLGRIRALLAKAESTEFPEEAEALSAKAQELMTRFSLDQALLEATAPQQVAPTASAIRMWLDAPYVKAKSRLVSAVARANR